MTWARRVLFGIACVLAVGMDGLTYRRLDAATNNPTVRIRRNTALNAGIVVADFNGDHIGDAVSNEARTGSPTAAIIALGNDGGTFGTPARIGCICRPLAAGDFNNDGKLDLLVVEEPSPDVTIFVMRGNGDGTFSAVPNSAVTQATFVRVGLIADINGDGKADVVLVVLNEDGDRVLVIPGNGDFTFQSTSVTFLTPGETALGAAIGDLNGDGKPDIVAASHDSASLTIFLNHGGFAFDTSTLTIDRQANDVAIVDLNHDGKMDLLVAATADGGDDLFSIDGYVYTFLGSGTGAFAAPVKYQTARGAWRVVVGDFSRDGILDVATANRSGVLSEDFCGHSWDSVSILPGTATGTFGAASSFSLGNQSNPDDIRFENSVLTLVAADVNGDGWLDLVASQGGIVLNQPNDPNWAPTVNAGPDRTANPDHSVNLRAIAGDVDQDLLTFTWTDSGGEPIEPSPAPCTVRPQTLGVHTFTVTVDDGHGHTASDSVQVDFGSGGGSSGAPIVSSIDAPGAGEVLAAGQQYFIRWSASAGSDSISHFEISYSTDDGATSHPIAECQEVGAFARTCRWNSPPVTESGRVTVTAVDVSSRSGSKTSARFAVRSTPGTPFGNGWSHADVGHVGAAGSASYDGLVLDGDAYTVSGSGADIWGTADGFHFAWTHFTGDFTIDAEVDSLQNTNAWAKAGIMVRANALDASSVHASIFVSPSKGIAFQRRITLGGSSASTQGPIIAAPIWLRVTRQGSLVRTLYRKQLTDPWTILGSQVISAFGAAVDVGLAVSSHADGAVATARFKGVFLGPVPNLVATAIGSATGSATTDGTTWTVRGSGSDIWGTSDNFLFAAMPIGDYEQITLRVRSVGNTDPWAKAGVMIRESLSANAVHGDAIVSPSKGIAMQDRSSTGGASASVVQMSGAAPVWLQLRRFEAAQPTATGGFSTWFSTDRLIWRRLGDVQFNTTHDAMIGIAVTSHKAGTETTAIIDDVRIER